MAGEHRATIDTVEQALSELSKRIRSADFVAAVRQIECAYPDKPRIGDQVRVRDDIVRMSQNVTLGFRGHILQSLEPTKGAHDYRLHVNFFGLLGSHGPMPLHYTEYADQRSRHHSDPTFKEFLDLFNHRMLSLFYRASVQFDPAVSFDRSDNNSYAEMLGALSGLMSEKGTDRDSISDNTKRYYPGWSTNTAKSPDGIAAIVEDYFGLPVSIKEWVGVGCRYQKFPEAGWVPGRQLCSWVALFIWVGVSGVSGTSLTSFWVRLVGKPSPLSGRAVHRLWHYMIWLETTSAMSGTGISN